jgi:amino acid adenylation domain-containing protein
MNKGTDNIEDIYPLAPLQEGLLFHTLYSPDSAVYFQQLKFSFKSDLKIEAWREAWMRVVERHAILRTGFVWENQPRPLQVVRKRVSLPWREEDWRGLSPDEQQRRFEEFLRDDQRCGFDLTKAPLLRLTLIRMGDADYQFICSQHHLLVDGWSTAIIIKELDTYYDAAAAGYEIDLEKPRPYRDYIAWLQQRDLSKAEAFWRGFLQGFTTPTTLAADSSSRSLTDEAGNQRKRQVVVSAETTALLRAFAQRQEITLNTIMVGAWAMLLSRYGGGDDVVFGLTVAGRPAALAGMESVVGPFINTLPVRVLLPPNDELGGWLRNLQLTLLELYEYDYSPLVQIQGWSQITRGAPLFESALVFENYPVAAIGQDEGSGAGFREVHSIERSSFPLGLIVVPGQELSLLIGYDCRLFDTDTIDGLLGHLQGVLENIASDPARPLSKISLWARTECDQVFEEWNGTGRDYRQDICLHHLFEEQVELVPNNVAVEFEEERLTYRELNRRANSLAHYLRASGIGPETLVGICIERSPDLIVAMLGVVKAGAAYVPLDPEYPEDRLNFILKDTRTPLILTCEQYAGRWPDQLARILCLDRDRKSIARHDETNPAGMVTADHPAYVIYTSGSTGQPKGVVVPHRAVCNTLLWRREAFSLTSRDRLLQNISYAFDPSVWQIFGTLANGARLVLAKPGGMHDPGYLIDQIIEREITITDAVPSVLQVLTELPGLERCQSLRHIFCGGEIITGELIKRFYARSEATLNNLYGPTETAIDATFWPIPRTANRRVALIGRPIANKQIWILDSRLDLMTVGAAGEVYIGGCGLARGYLNNPALTAEAFIPDPFSGESGARMYRTGDLARYLPDGNIEFMGRNDNQVKVRGLRIELGEIEAVLASHPGVRHNAVLVREDPPGNKQLVAYLVSRNGAHSLDQIRNFASQRLPEYMIPSRFALIDSLPLLSSGKVDREALSLLSPEWAVAEAGYVSPRTRLEEAMARVWAEILRAERVGVNDNFFHLGGHSLTAMRLISALRAAFQVDLPLRALFENPTISSLAEIVDSRIRITNEDSSPLAPLSPRQLRENNPPMSFAQQRLWYLNRLMPDSAFYNIAEIFSLRGPLCAATLEDSLNEIARRHEALRTTFGMQEGQLVQIVSTESRVRLRIDDLSFQAEDGREAEARRLAGEEAQRPFDLEQGPLIRAILLKLDHEHHWFLLTIHHIISDGWSLEVLMEELSTSYNAFRAGAVPDLPELPVQYADYAVWQRDRLQGDVLRAELAYWGRQLDGTPGLVQLPTDRPRPRIRNSRGATATFVVNEALAGILRRLSQQESATMFMTMLGAFKILLYRYSSQSDLVVGAAIAGRNRREVEKLIGLFVNMLALRTVLSGELSFREVLKRVREVTLEAYAHQELPFEKLIEELQPVRDSSRTPIFQITFSVQNVAELACGFHDLSIEAVRGAGTGAKFDLEISLLDTGRDLHGAIQYDLEIFDAETIERMMSHFQILLASAVSSPDMQIAKLALISDAERSQLLFEFNRDQTGRGLYVLDPQMEPAPCGVVGELYIVETSVSREDLKEPGRAANAFRPDPFTQWRGGGLYRTGDLARWSADGKLIYSGRIDRQIRVRGLRIDPGEIEAVLNCHPSLRESLVMQRDPEEGIVAYLVMAQRQSHAAVELRDYLTERLPDYLVPSRFVFLDTLPVTPQGEVDYQALSELHPAQAEAEAEDSYVPPRDNFELALVRIWEDLLQVSPIGIADNFYDLGGHSLSALRLVVAIRRYFGRTLPLAALLENGTIEHLARLLRDQFAPLPHSPLVALQPAGQRPPVFFAHVGSGQVLCYFDLARLLGPDQPFYGLQDPNLSGVGRPFDSIEDMAGHYIEAIRTVQPTGPYLLGGWSFGGLVSFEMARQFSESGERVSLLALLDTGTPDLHRRFTGDHDDATLLAILAQEMDLPVSAADLRPLDLEGQLQYVAHQMREARIVLDDAPMYLKRQLEIFRGRYNAVETYTPAPYNGRITLFAASTLEPDIAARQSFDEHRAELVQGWADLSAGEVDFHLIPGRHHEIAREPNVQALARLLRACIDEVSGAVEDDRAEAEEDLS